MAIVLPEPERSRAAASPAAPPPIMITSTSFADDFGPRKLADLLHLLVDLRLRGFFAQNAAEVIDFRRDELVVLRQEADSGALKIAFRHRDHLAGAQCFVGHTELATSYQMERILWL